MKAEILKIAGVKSEKEFYKKYPTEAAFKKAHGKAFKKAQLGATMQDKGQLTKLDQLTSFDNPPQAQVGTNVPQYLNPNTIGYNEQGLFDPGNPADKIIAPYSPSYTGPIDPNAIAATTSNPAAAAAKSVSGSGADIMGKLGGIGGITDTITGVVGGIQELGQEKKQAKLANQSMQVSGLALQAASTRAEKQKRRYNEPNLVQGMNPGGVGTNPLARDGMKIGGNPTEIQNMYNPGDIYQDQGFEPLSDSEIVKQYRAGGFTPRAQSGATNQMVGSLMGGTNAGGKIGGSVGSAAGTLIGGPLGGMIGGALGTIGGNLLDPYAKDIKKDQDKALQNTQSAAMQSGIQSSQNQNAGFVRNGGVINYEEGGWVSHDWQPQVITQFGEHKMSDLLKRSPEMDTLRTGGHIKQNEMFPQDKYAFGGELKTTWGGHAEPISQNPYLPGTGETVMFRGKSHEESDGNGHTGIGVTYGNKSQDSYTDYAEFGSQDADADVEVERGEPATELEDSETGEKNMVVYGNLKIPNMFLHELGDPSAKGKKFKNYANDLSKQEAKQNKIIENATEKINNLTDFTQFGKMKLDTFNMMQTGAKMKLKDIAAKKIKAADLQHALNKTAEEHGLEADAMVDNLIKGKLVKAKDSNGMAKFGAELFQAQKGTKKKKQTAAQPEISTKPGWMQGSLVPSDYPQMTLEDIAQGQYTIPPVEIDPFKGIVPQDLDEERYNTNPNAQSKLDQSLYDFHKKALAKNPLDREAAKYTSWFKDKYPSYQDAPKGQLYDQLVGAANQILPYVRPSDQERLDPNQLMGEMYAMSQNQQEPVPAQFYRPDLGQTSDISLQDQLNANQSDFNALQRTTGYNPSAQAALAAQKYAANSSVLGKQFQMNQSERQTMNDANRTLQNQAQLQNLQIADTQYGRQSMAKSKTKEQAQAALNSISDKIAKHKLENRQLGIYENMYNYRYDSKGRLINMNPLQQFNTTAGRETLPLASKDNIAPGYEDTYNASGQRIGTRKKGKDDAEQTRNGRIVKAIKNL